MRLESGIQAFLRADTELITLIGDTSAAKGIYWLDAPTTLKKYVLFQKLSAPAVHDSTDNFERWSFLVFHKSPSTAKKIQQRLAVLLNRKIEIVGGFPIDFIRYIDSIDPEKIEGGIYRAVSDFRIYYH